MSSNSKFASLWQWCRRYISPMLIAVVVFMLYVLFFNENSVMRSYELNREIEQLKAEIHETKDTLDYYHDLNRRLESDPETMERIVREQYHMQRDNEDVYVFTD